MRRGPWCFFVLVVLASFVTTVFPADDPLPNREIPGTIDELCAYAPNAGYSTENALYFIGDTANPRCSTFIPMRLNTVADTNYWYHGALWANRGDWGNADPSDSVRITNPCADESQWLAAKDKSIMMHYSCIPAPDGFPADDPQSDKFWCTGTPLSIVGNACEEDIHVFMTEDLWNVSNRLGLNPGDTISNPLFLPANIIIDTVYWYLQPGQNGLDSFYTFYDTGRFVPESVLEASYNGADTIHTWINSVHTADPRLLAGPDGYLYLFFLAAFSRGWYHGGHFNCVKAGSVYVARSSNGYIWQDLTRIIHLNTVLTSPAPIVETDGSATMWMASAGDMEAAYRSGEIYKFSSEQIIPDTGFWPPAIPCIHDFVGDYDSCNNERIWHIGVKAAGETDRMMVFNTTSASCDEFIGLCTSSNRGDNWTCQKEPLLTVAPGRWDATKLYAPELMASDSVASGWLLFYSGYNKDSRQWHPAFTPVVANGSASRVLGDANQDGFVNVGDAVFIIYYIFKGGAAPDPLTAGDINGDCQVNIGDAVYLISYIFKGGAPPQPACGN